MSSNEILREFLLETHENLALLDADLLTLEKNPSHKDTLAQVFRTLHSVKGTAGFMGFVKLQSVAHASESLLSRLRAGEMQFNPTIATALLKVVDAIREMLSHIEASEGEGDGDYSALIAEIDRLRDGGPDATWIMPGLPEAVIEKPVPVPPPPQSSPPASATTVDLNVPLPPPPAAAPVVAAPPPASPFASDVTLNLSGPLPPISFAVPVAPKPQSFPYASDVTLDLPDKLPPSVTEPVVTPPLQSSPYASDVTLDLPAGSPVTAPVVTPAQSSPYASDTTLNLSVQLPPLPAAAPIIASTPPTPAPAACPPPAPTPPSPVVVAPPTVESAPSEPVESRPPSLADSTIRVDVNLLDKLMTLMGELVLARNQILQYSALQEDGGFLGTVQRLNLLTTELQASVMKTRMQPIGNVLGKFPRIVRDLAIACGKKVRFEMEGQDTELDRTLLEAIRDPLTHMVRNAVDHGIETPEVRKAHGKSEEGRLRMVAFHEGGKVIVEITDDGGGIDIARVREKAVQNKLVTSLAASRMSKQELLQLIFLPGFSTAERVTQFSGRGVGMDVVRTNIEKIGGTVDLESSAGQGTTIRTKIPLTLAIIPALIIVSGRERYAIPQVSLLELVRHDADQASQGIEWLHGVPVYRLRGTLLPLVFLNEQLKLEASTNATTELNIVVLQADERQFGLVVDAIRDTEEIVVKPLQKQLKGISVFAGAAIMGDGRVALVLDVLGLAQQANVVSGSKSRMIAERERPQQSVAAEMEPLLLFAPSAGGQMAIPLSQVARLEEFPRTRLEQLGPRQVVQYRGEILSLIDVSRAIDCLQTDQSRRNDKADSTGDTVPVVVYCQDNRQVGLMVDKILDIVAHPTTTLLQAGRPGVLCTTVVQEKVTEIVDVPALLAPTA